MTQHSVGGPPGGDARFSWSGDAAELRPRPAAAMAPPPPAPVYSRWRGGATSFGPAGRIVATALVVGVGVGLLLVEPLSGIVWMVIAWPLALPSIWKRERVR